MNSQDALRTIQLLAESPAIDLPANTGFGDGNGDIPCIYHILRGMVMQCHYAEDGERQVCRVFRPGNLIGLENLARSDLSMCNETLVPTILMRIPLSRLHERQRHDPQIQQAILHLLARELADGYHLKANLGTGTAMRRICRFLLWSARGNRCFLPPRDKLGSIISSTTETASRMIASLRRQGLLRNSTTQPATVVIDLEQIRKRAGDYWDHHAA